MYRFQEYFTNLSPGELEVCKILQTCKGIATQSEIINIRAKNRTSTLSVINRLVSKRFIEKKICGNNHTAIIKLKKK